VGAHGRGEREPGCGPWHPPTLRPKPDGEPRRSGTISGSPGRYLGQRLGQCGYLSWKRNWSAGSALGMAVQAGTEASPFISPFVVTPSTASFPQDGQAGSAPARPLAARVIPPRLAEPRSHSAWGGGREAHVLPPLILATEQAAGGTWPRGRSLLLRDWWGSVDSARWQHAAGRGGRRLLAGVRSASIESRSGLPRPRRPATRPAPRRASPPRRLPRSGGCKRARAGSSRASGNKTASRRTCRDRTLEDAHRAGGPHARHGGALPGQLCDVVGSSRAAPHPAQHNPPVTGSISLGRAARRHHRG